MSWDKVKLGEIATFINGYPFKPSQWSKEGLEIIRIQNLTKSSSTDYNYFQGNIPEKYKVIKGDVLISWSATLGIFEWEGEDAWLNQHIFKVVFDKLEVDKRFFHYLILSVLEKLKRKVHGATMQHITKGNFDNTLVSLPPLAIQKQIACILDKSEALFRKDQRLLSKYEQLSHAIFIDMFGDPVKNEKGWELKTIEQLTAKTRHSIKRGPFGGALKKEIFVKDGYLVYEQFHALNNDFSFGRYYINEDKYKELIAFKVEAGDIIISCSGIYLGKLAIVPINAKAGIINQALLKLTLDESIYQNEFFVKVFSQENFKAKYFASERGAAIPNFPPISAFKEFKFIVPPIELQNQYLRIVNNLKEQTYLVDTQFNKSNELFNILIQKAFNEELVN